MIATRFSPLDIECLVKTAVELWEEIDPSDLPENQQDTLNRARDAMLAEHAGRQPAFPEVVTFISPHPAGQVFLLRYWDASWDPKDGPMDVYADEDSALADLAEYVRGAWRDIEGEQALPEEPPADDREAVRLYYGPGRNRRPGMGYSLDRLDVIRRGRTRIVPLGYRFPDEDACEQANRDAAFHPQTNDDTLPCTKVDGVLVFSYLDYEAGAVRVSVHLGSAEDRLVRPDGTVPLRVEVEDTVVLDSRAEAAPGRDLLNKLLDVADDHQEEANP
ncbi:hypothetical protein ACFY1A_38920 [Streptomyces sp. NPDC001520]|uniref:hypothetical protein n=1 Tax=Streptomyces sp. NPDC001520 TaxID=3364581 RepID=UPI0036B3B0F9